MEEKMKAKLAISVIFVLIMLAACETAGAEKLCPPNCETDLAINVCYEISGNKVLVQAVIENVGTKTFDQGGSYKVEAICYGTTHSTLIINFPASPWTLKPGEMFFTEKVEPPFYNPIYYTSDEDKKNLAAVYYAEFNATVTGNGDQNPSNDVSEIFTNHVNVFKLIEERKNYACPSPFN